MCVARVCPTIYTLLVYASYVIFILLWSFWEMGPRLYFLITVLGIGDDVVRNYRLCKVRDSDHCGAKWSKVLDDKIRNRKVMVFLERYVQVLFPTKIDRETIFSALFQ